MASEPSTGELMGRVTAEEINSLPEHLRRYVRDLETICDPAGMVQEIAGLKMQVAELAARYERGKAEGVRDEREACAVVVDALATRLATTVHECAHELGLACAVCDASREAHATVSALRARGAAQPPVQAEGKGGA